jgi:hypothetical protein
MDKRSSNDIGANLNERMADRPRPEEPQLDETALPIIDTDSQTADAPAIDDV